MTLRFGDHNWHELVRHVPTEDGRSQALPRHTSYGSLEAANIGLVPLLDYPDLLVQPDQFKEVITECRELQMFPEFHQKQTWMPDDQPDGKRWNQDGLPYCWAWGMTAAVMDCRAVEGKETILLAPNSLGWLVNWRSNGFYLDGTIAGAAQRGIAPQAYVPNILSRNPDTFKDGWEQKALLYRPSEWFDTKRESVTSMIQQCLTILRSGRSGYVGNDEWSHAYNICGMKWDETEKYNVVWVTRNSHDEPSTIELTGEFGVPDEFYGVRSTIENE